MIRKPALPLLLPLLACAPSEAPPPGGLDLDLPCDFGPESADALALITNNFVDPAGLARIDLAGPTLTPDLLPATTDTVLGASADHLVMVHRFGTNRLDLVSRADWSLVGSADVAAPGVAEPNPQGVVFDGEGLAYVPLFGAPAVQVYDFTRAPGDWLAGSVDLSAFADDDGSPEAGAALVCGRTLFVGIQRLVDFTPVDRSYLVAVDLDERAPIDLDPDAEGVQAIELLGPWPKQFRRDPSDPERRSALVLTSGVERVDLRGGTSSWAVAPERLAAAGLDGFDLQAFALAPDGASIYLTATDGEFPAQAVFHVGLDDAAPETPVKVIEGLSSGDRMLERLGDTLWVGDAAADAPRVRAWDLASGAPEEVEASGVAAPIAPWTFIALP